LYATSSAMRQIKKRQDLGVLGPTLQFFDQTSEMQALREAYRTGLSAIPGVDYSGPRQVEQSIHSDSVNPKKINPSASSKLGPKSSSLWTKFLLSEPKCIQPSSWLTEPSGTSDALPPESGLPLGPPLDILKTRL